MTDQPEEGCDHDWEIVDESFDHAFGTEVYVFRRCTLCDLEDHNYVPPTYNDYAD